MKGEMFNLLEEFVVAGWGRSHFEEIYAEAKKDLSSPGPFIGPGTYPDTDFMALVSSAVRRLQVPLGPAVRALGKFAFPHLAAKLPDHMAKFKHPKEFLKTVDRVVHVEVRKLYRDAETPRFSYREPAQDRLIMVYHSRRKLYDLVEGLLEGTAEYFKVPMAIKRKVIGDGDQEGCEFEITFG